MDISPSESKENTAVAITLVDKGLPSSSFASGCGKTIEGADLYSLSALPNIFTFAINKDT